MTTNVSFYPPQPLNPLNAPNALGKDSRLPKYYTPPKGVWGFDFVCLRNVLGDKDFRSPSASPVSKRTGRFWG
jgi:hypothetical protein